MKILVPTDFSENARHALHYAALLANSVNGEILLYHFVPIPVYSSDAPIVLPSEDELKKESVAGLEKLAAELRSTFPNIKITTEARASINFPEDAIINEETSCASDLVVMGTKGRGAVASKLLGSNTATVIEYSCCPVIAIPADAPVRLPQRIAIAVNYADSDLENTISIIELFAKLNATFTIVHVTNKNEDPAIADAELEGLAMRAREHTGNANIHTDVIGSDDTMESLNHWLSENKTDLIAVSMRKRTFFEKLFGRSMTRKMLYHTHMPLMALSVKR